MIEKTWLEVALIIGVSYDQFWHLTPHALKIMVDAYNKRRQHQLEYDNVVAFLQGQYFCLSLASTVGNMFTKKGGQKNEYPKEPFDISGRKEERELTEDEKQIQVQAIFANLERMKANFERAKKGESN